MISLAELQTALEASWDEHTAYLAAVRPGNPAYGQCYPTSRVVQHFFPDLEVAGGEVDTGDGIEYHFCNVRITGDTIEYIDLSWQQFPPGSRRLPHRILPRDASDDGPGTQRRCALLLERVTAALANFSKSEG